MKVVDSTLLNFRPIDELTKIARLRGTTPTQVLIKELKGINWEVEEWIEHPCADVWKLRFPDDDEGIDVKEMLNFISVAHFLHLNLWIGAEDGRLVVTFSL